MEKDNILTADERQLAARCVNLILHDLYWNDEEDMYWNTGDIVTCFTKEQFKALKRTLKKLED